MKCVLHAPGAKEWYGGGCRRVVGGVWLLEQKLVDEQCAVVGGEEEWCLAVPGRGGVGVGKGGARGVEEEEEEEEEEAEEGWHFEGNGVQETESDGVVGSTGRPLQSNAGTCELYFNFDSEVESLTAAALGE